ncbi:MAG: dimethylhistidine N-methyltransferase [Cyclobacteriaceae bacterium]|nr:MAG: dimethylhistidine N-methyltransferase [Cyclobacteriaceae bacterium]
MDDQFARDIMHGLSSTPKYLSSKYFYDKQGDLLFQKIMNLEEYYLTRCEYEIFQNQKDQLLQQFSKDTCPFDLIEFGAGDGKKTKVLLEYFLQQGADFSYKPIDISRNALELLAKDLRKSLPGLDLETLQGEYFDVLSHAKSEPNRRKVVLFLGSNIGNFLKPVAVKFLSQLANSLSQKDLLLIGVDLVKDPKTIARAYNDSQGITREFNLNLLTRINRDLGADFDLDNFDHFPIYNPITGTARSFLISRAKQTVSIERLNASFHFEAWEPVHTEYSHKYRIDELAGLADESGFKVVNNYFDSKMNFVDCLWQLDD